MARDSFKVVPEKRVGKTQILIEGEPGELEQVKNHFDSVRSSEVYPSFDEDYDYSLFFYETEEAFLKKLYSFAKENLTGLKKRETTSRVWLVKWIFISGGLLFLLYFLYRFVIFIAGAVVLLS